MDAAVSDESDRAPRAVARGRRGCHRLTHLAPVIVAGAGRRIDLPGSQPERFPLRNVERVGGAISEALAAIPVAAVVCSAACGADLLILKAASALGIRRRIVLPFDVDRFRRASVLDRPGNWGPLFDVQVTAVRTAGDLVVLDSPLRRDEAYVQANNVILGEAERIAGPAAATTAALVAWDGASRGPADVTARFYAEAASRGWTVFTVSTV